MRKTDVSDCKAETEGSCSFDCIDCCYQSKVGLKHFRYLYNLNTN